MASIKIRYGTEDDGTPKYFTIPVPDFLVSKEGDFPSAGSAAKAMKQHNQSTQDQLDALEDDLGTVGQSQAEDAVFPTPYNSPRRERSN